jgi:methionyl-tRNA synthetase
VSSQYNGVIPDGNDAPGPYSPNDADDAEFISNINTLLKDYADAMDAVKIRLGLQTVMLISGRGNVYLQSSGLNKALIASNPIRCARVISRAINLIYVLSSLIYPFMPATSSAILVQLNAPDRAVPELFSNDILAGHTIGSPEHLFKKIDEKMEEVWRLNFKGNDEKLSGSAVATTPDPLKTAAPGQSKRKAAKKVAAGAGAGAATSIVSDGPKSAEVLALEAKIAEQGQAIRALKTQTPKTPELDAQIKAAVDVLKALKTDLENAKIIVKS